MAAPWVRIRLPAVFRSHAGGRAEVRVQGATVGEALGALCETHPALLGRLLGADGGVRRYVSVFLNDDDVRQLGGAGATLRDGDELTIVPALSGGAGEGVDRLLPEDGARVRAVCALAFLAEESPRAEICGFLLTGGAGEPSLVPVRNAAVDPALGFSMDAADLLRVLRELEAAGRAVAAIYHSHVTGSACLSAADAAGLTAFGGPVFPGAELWIAGVERGRAVEVRAYGFAGTGWLERFRLRGPFTTRESSPSADPT